MKHLSALLMSALIFVMFRFYGPSANKEQTISPNQFSQFEDKHTREQMVLADEWRSTLCELNTAFVGNDMESWKSLSDKLNSIERQLGGIQAVVNQGLIGNGSCDREDIFLEQYASRICSLFQKGEYVQAMMAIGFVASEMPPHEQMQIDVLVQKNCP